MRLLLITSVLLLVHFTAYCLWLRRWKQFQSERIIFAYHFWPAVILTTAIALGWLGPARISESIGAIALQGIYSLSFLEVWSLSQGSYSVSILVFAHRRGAVSESDLQTFVDLGNSKQSARLAGLQRLGLIHVSEDRVRLTRRGRVAAAGLSALCRLSNLRHVG